MSHLFPDSAGCIEAFAIEVAITPRPCSERRHRTMACHIMGVKSVRLALNTSGTNKMPQTTLWWEVTCADPGRPPWNC